MIYYKTVTGKKWDAALPEAAEKTIGGKGAGRISKDDAKILLEKVKGGNSLTDVEKNTMAYIRENFKYTE